MSQDDIEWRALAPKPERPIPEGWDSQDDIETLAREFHEVYQIEAKRQGDVRHHDDYDALPENIKEFDRVLARHVLARLAAAEEERDVYENALIRIQNVGDLAAVRVADEALSSTQEESHDSGVES